MSWDYPNPIFVDFETQSTCDIQEQGGRLYAFHPSTRILIGVVYIDGVFHVWIPDYIKVDTWQWPETSLWPNELQPKLPVRLYRGSSLPNEIQDACEQRPCVAHNAFGFDRYIWTRFCESRPEWLDSLYLARLSNRSAKLDALSKSMLGVGKDRAKKLLPILTTAHNDIFGSVKYPTIKTGDLQAFTRYAVADVELTRRLWHGELSTVAVEADVIETHNYINERGIRVDVPLLSTIEAVAKYSTEQAAATIDKLTGGKIPPNKLRSTATIHDWLWSYGVCITDEGRLDKTGKPKQSLRKEIVQKFIDSKYFVPEDHLRAIQEIPPVVMDVLKLRMKALRITDAKVKKAQLRVEPDGRIRDLISYCIAGTRRFSSSGVQIHNLPRPSKWMNEHLQQLLDLTELKNKDVRKVYDALQAQLPPIEEGKPAITVDDVCSAFVRPSIIPANGKSFLIADYEQIEARGIGWIAGEKKLLDIFERGGDPYREFASKVYNVPLDQVTSDMRDVGKVGILGLGYGMGAMKMRIFAANSGVDLTKAGVTADYMVNTYRDTYTKIAGWKPKRPDGMESNYRIGGIWKDLDKAVKDCVATGQSHHVGRCMFHMQGKDLICTLPSGGQLYYPNARIEDVIPPYVWTMNLPPNPKATVVYDSNRGVKSLFGGLIAENIVQAVSRDILATALVKLDRAGFNPVLHVHDEIICEVEKGQADRLLPKMMQIMIDRPRWAEDFPIACEGYVSPRFVKKPWAGYLTLKSKNLNSVKG